MCNPLSLLFIHNTVLSDPLHHSTHWHYITSNQIISKKNHTQYLYFMPIFCDFIKKFVLNTTHMVFLLENEHLNCLYFQLIGYLRSFIYSQCILFRRICSHGSLTTKKRHLFKSYIFAGMHPLVYLLMKTSIGLWQDFFHLCWHKSTAITVTLFKLLLCWMCQSGPHDLL